MSQLSPTYGRDLAVVCLGLVGRGLGLALVAAILFLGAWAFFQA